MFYGHRKKYDKVTSTCNYDYLQDVFEELYNDLENLGLKNTSLKVNLFSSKWAWWIEITTWNLCENKTSLDKEKDTLEKKNDWLTSFLIKFSCGPKAFDMILTN